MKCEKFRGVIPAFYACYDDEGHVSAERTKVFARHLILKGVQGLYVNGSSGECIYLRPCEKKTILEAVMEAVGGQCTVIAHVACNNTEDSMALAAHAESLKVDAIAAIPPIYFHLPEDAIAAYWNDISGAAPHTDFMIYNIPLLAGVALTPALFLKMRENPRMKAVKNSSMSAYDIETFVRLGGGECAVFNGPDEQFSAGRAVGACGGIGGTYAVMPELFLAMDRLIREGKPAEAARIQHEVNAIIEIMAGCRGNLYAVMKKVLAINEGLELGGVRRPLPALAPEDIPRVTLAAERIRRAVKAL